MKNELSCYGISRLSNMIQKKQITPLECIEAHIVQIEKHNKALNAVVTFCFDEALETAKKAEKNLKYADICGGMYGIPFLVKDLYDTIGVRTTYGLNSFREHVPKKDSYIVNKLKSQGAILLGKTNTPEFGYGFITENQLFGTTQNPRNAFRTAGGSSGGDAAAVASHFSPIAIGSDLGGSIRIPAHCCGVCGFRPTPGRLSIEGHCTAGTPIIWSLSSPGILARSVSDISFAFSQLDSFNYADPFAFDYSSIRKRVPKSMHDGLKIAVILFEECISNDTEIIHFIEESANALTGTKGAWKRTRFILDRRLAHTMRVLIGTHLKESIQHFFKISKISIDSDNFKLKELFNIEDRVSDLMDAIRNQYITTVSMNMIFMRYDLCIMPILPFTAPALWNEKGEHLTSEYIFKSSIANFVSVLAKLPSLALPVGTHSDGMPIGVQIVGKQGNDSLVLKAGMLLEHYFGNGVTGRSNIS